MVSPFLFSFFSLKIDDCFGWTKRMAILQQKKMSYFKKRLYLIINRTRERE